MNQPLVGRDNIDLGLAFEKPSQIEVKAYPCHTDGSKRDVVLPTEGKRMVQKTRLFKIKQMAKEKSVYYIEKDQLLLGRSEEADVFCQHTGISRQHLIVTVDKNNLFIEDQGTSNGTKLNGQKIEGHRSIPYVPGTTIQLGTCPDLFEITLFTNVNALETQLPAEMTSHDYAALNPAPLNATPLNATQMNVTPWSLPTPPAATQPTFIDEAPSMLGSEQSPLEETLQAPSSHNDVDDDVDVQNVGHGAQENLDQGLKNSAAQALAFQKLENDQQLKALLQSVKEKSKLDYQKIIHAAELQRDKILSEAKTLHERQKKVINEERLAADLEFEKIESQKVQGLLEVQLIAITLKDEQKKLLKIQNEIKSLKSSLPTKS